MLPPGHIAAGYLVGKAVVALARPALSPMQLTLLPLWGALFGFAPDLDTFYAFTQTHSLTIPSDKVNHRRYITHAPLLWLTVGIVVMLLASSTYWRYVGLMIWLGSWSHFVLDSFKVGIRWLYPLSDKFFALDKPGVKEVAPSVGFWPYWWWFTTRLRRHFGWS